MLTCCVHPAPLTTAILVVSFHALTKCKFCNSFALIFMQDAGGDPLYHLPPSASSTGAAMMARTRSRSAGTSSFTNPLVSMVSCK